MIFIYHQNNTIASVFNGKGETVPFQEKRLALGFYELCQSFPDEIVVWCEVSCTALLNKINIPNLLKNKRKLISYHPTDNFFSKSIGYIEDSPYINVNKNVSYPTWQMSSLVGAVSGRLIAHCDLKVFQQDFPFDFILSSIAKTNTTSGIFAYSEPGLLLDDSMEILVKSESKMAELFVFVKQHYKIKWTLMLLLNLLVFEKKFPFWSFCKTLFFSEQKSLYNVIKSDCSLVDSSVLRQQTIDVVIPTIGRKQYLFDILIDLKHQEFLPQNVIIVEQNASVDSVSELDYITSETWPFKIKHFFIHELGACNARNVALKQLESDWVFFADDDIRIERNFLSKGLTKLVSEGIEALVFKCLGPNQKSKEENFDIAQTTIFGSGSSIVRANKVVAFNTAFEFGYGEDIEFGLHLRNKGTDVYYTPNPYIVHLKAPIGGFRYKHHFPWDDDMIKPIPSPTILLYKKMYHTIEQIKGYQLFFFFHRLTLVKPFNLITFYKKYRKHWDSSVYWSNKMQHEIEQNTF